MRVGSGQAAEITAFAHAHAGDEEAHGALLRLTSALSLLTLLGLLAWLAASLGLLRQRQVGAQQHECKRGEQRSFLGHHTGLRLSHLN